MKKSKKILSVILILTVVLSLAACSNKKTAPVSNIKTVDSIPKELVAEKTVTPASTFAGGDGSEKAPFQISNAAELAFMAKIFNSSKDYDMKKYQTAHYELTADIQINTPEQMASADKKAPTYRWEPIAQADLGTSEAFKGNFNGNGHTVSGLYIRTLGGDAHKIDSAIGLFGVTRQAKINNVTVADSLFYVYNSAQTVGAIASDTYFCTIESCHTEQVSIYAQSADVGGIIGNAIGTVTVKDCSSQGKITAAYSSNIGGIISGISDGVLENCTNKAEIIAKENASAGGICSIISDSAKNTSWEENLKNPKEGVGKTTVKNCTNNGTVTADFEAGGIAASASGANSSSLVSGCKNTGKITSKNLGAGLITRCWVSKNTVDKKANNIGSLLVEKCSNTGEVNATKSASGITTSTSAKDGASLTVSDCQNGAGVTGEAASGICTNCVAASNSSITLKKSSNSGAVTSTGSDASGIMGIITANCNECEKGYHVSIDSCENSGEILSTKDVGGILATIKTKSCDNDKVDIKNCKNSGSISGKFDSSQLTFAGGILGEVSVSGKKDLAKIENCSNTGDINIDFAKTDPKQEKVFCYAGGLAGTAPKSFEYINCTSTGSLNVSEGNKKFVGYDKICGLKAK